MIYDEAVAFMLEGGGEIKPGLDRIKSLIKRLSNPHFGMKIIHVAGTNGKGSVAAYIAAVLIEAGFRVGKFNSPWVSQINECISVDGISISDFEMTQVVEEILPFSSSATSFEKLTALAFCHFRNSKCEFVVLETGMGGKLDATNFIANNLISVITKISIDHEEFLGKTLEEIAIHKAGIIKTNSPVISAPQEPVVKSIISKIAEAQCSEIINLNMNEVKIVSMTIGGSLFQFFGYSGKIIEYRTGLLGKHQVENACIAILALHQIFRRNDRYRNNDEIDNIIEKGISKARWPGRFEVIRNNPWIIVDGAHNVSGTEAMIETVKDLFPGIKPIFIIGMLKDKEVEAMLKLVSNIASKIVTVSPDTKRALESSKLAKIASNYFENVHECGKIGSALKEVMENTSMDDLIIICGSLYLMDRINLEGYKNVI